MRFVAALYLVPVAISVLVCVCALVLLSPLCPSCGFARLCYAAVTARRGGPRKNKPDASPVIVLKRSTRWACVKNCGACCYLAVDDRPELEGLISGISVEISDGLVFGSFWKNYLRFGTKSLSERISSSLCLPLSRHHMHVLTFVSILDATYTFRYMWAIQPGVHRKVYTVVVSLAVVLNSTVLLRCLPHLLSQGIQRPLSLVDLEVEFCAPTTLSFSTAGHGLGKKLRSSDCIEIRSRSPPVWRI